MLNATWLEFDLDKGVWTVPAIRMKAGHEHRIPLTERAVQLLKSLPRLPHNDHVFPGHGKGKPLSGTAMTMQLRRMNRGDITVHGFRSTFRDWASEQTSFPHETCEGNPPVFGGGLEVEFSRYFERGDSDEEEQIYGGADRRDPAAG